jgi:hypothetical protein
MLTELCGEIRNWFDKERELGDFTVAGGIVSFANGDRIALQDGQFYRIIGSVFNDGVHQYHADTPDEELHPEEFAGAVWILAIPKEVQDLAKDISDWVEKYGAKSSSPFASESLSASSYSYSKNESAGDGAGATWQNIFASRMDRWRKI